MAGQQQGRDQGRVKLDGDTIGAFRQPMPVAGPPEHTLEPAEEQLDGPALVVDFGDLRGPETLPIQLVGDQDLRFFHHGGENRGQHFGNNRKVTRARAFHRFGNRLGSSLLKHNFLKMQLFLTTLH